MTQWVKVANVNEIPEHGCFTLTADDINIAVFNLQGQFFAIENVCTHDGGTLTGGPVIGDEVVCPRHGARFCIKTGEVMAPPAYEDVRVFPVKVEENLVFVEVDAS